MTTADGDALISGLVAGNDEAFAMLFDRYAAPLFRIAQSLLGSRHDAEDVVQEVFVGVVRVRHTLANVAELK